MTQRSQEIFGNFMTMKRLMMAHFREVMQHHDFGLKPSQIEVLFAVHTMQPLCFKDLGRHLMLQPAAVTQLVDSLVEEGYLTRAISEDDRRTWFVSLTDAGQAKLAEFKPYMHERKHIIHQVLTDTEIDDLIRMQTKIITGLQSSLDTKTKEGDKKHG